ncbi:MAG TPA: Maf family protein [Woeseiaceae bacterium]|nr:Maf family protein [Woeseiaceae bacterium]
MTEARLHLASASPRRREILAAIGVAHSYAGVGMDETAAAGEPAFDLALRLALAKARAALAAGRAEPVILGADTVVSLDAELFGKPASEEEAVYMLSRLSGRVHTVHTAIAVLSGSRELSSVSGSEVHFREIGPDEARAYWRTGEPEGKAGAYAIQGRGGIFVAALAGSYSGVVGLPVYETALLLRQAGIDVLPRERPSPHD